MIKARQILTPGTLRGGVGLVGYALGAAYVMLLGRYAPVAVANPVAYLLGLFNLALLFTSPGASTYASCSLTPLYTSLAATLAIGVVLHPAYWPITTSLFSTYILLHMFFIRNVEYARWRAGKELSWGLATLPYTIGARVIQLALAALAILYPQLWVLALTLPLPLGQLLNNLAYRGVGYRGGCGGGSWVDGFKFTLAYHAPYIPLNILYIIAPGQSTGILVGLAFANTAATVIQADKLWGRRHSPLFFVLIPASALFIALLEYVGILNRALLASLPLTLPASVASAILAYAVPLRIRNSD